MNDRQAGYKQTLGSKSSMNKRTMPLAVLPILVMFLVLGLVTACNTGGGTEDGTAVGLPNPASEYCVEQGGMSTIETRGDGGQYGVCVFEDNMQCEEFAMMNGECPVGGIRVTGYATDAARYCAISGGTYTATGGTNSDGQEEGTCTLSDGESCDVFAYYDGTCGS